MFSRQFSSASNLRLHLHLHWFIILCVSMSNWADVASFRLKRSAPVMDDDTTIRTEYVDRNNRTILAMFNLTEAQINRIFESNSANSADHSAQARDSQRFHVIKEYRINDIRNRLQSAFQASNSEENQEHPLHEMAAYPICNSESTESSWLQDNNVTIRFSDSLFEPKRDNLNLDSAILRLYKVNPNGTDDPNASENDEVLKTKSCTDPFMQLSPQIRVTVSIVQQLRRNKRERKKRICNTIMMNVSKTGWVEIDIKRAIYIWESVERQQQQQQQQQARQQPVLVGWLMIEVHDEEERPLKPGLFFKPPKCDQADLAIPWNYYGPHTSMSPFAANEVPRYPRLDVKLIGYASFAPKNHDKELHDKLRRNLRRQIYNLSKSSSEASADNASTTSVTPTADNSIEPSASTEIQHQHTPRKRHSAHNSHHFYNQGHRTQPSERYSTQDHYAISSAETTPEKQQALRGQHRGHHRRHHRQHHSQMQQPQQRPQDQQRRPGDPGAAQPANNC